MSKPTIYRDFNHWFSQSHAHGMSSCSRDYVKGIWDELEPTIKASQDDYKQYYLELAKEVADNRSEMVDAMLEYIKEHKQEGQPSFFRWWYNRIEHGMTEGD